MDSRERYLQKKYGLSVRQWAELYAMQEGKCPICLNSLQKPGNALGKRAACVDHDHKTGRVRGLLCYRCNKLRVSVNTVETAQRMVPYLGSELDGRKL